MSITGGQFAPKQGGQFALKQGGQFAPKRRCQFGGISTYKDSNSEVQVICCKTQ